MNKTLCIPEEVHGINSAQARDVVPNGPCLISSLSPCYVANCLSGSVVQRCMLLLPPLGSLCGSLTMKQHVHRSFVSNLIAIIADIWSHVNWQCLWIITATLDLEKLSYFGTDYEHWLKKRNVLSISFDSKIIVGLCLSMLWCIMHILWLLCAFCQCGTTTELQTNRSESLQFRKQCLAWTCSTSVKTRRRDVNNLALLGS